MVHVTLPTQAHLLPDLTATRLAGKLLARHVPAGLVVALIGDLGAGKTSLVKATVAELGGAEEDDVVSPTFVLATEYSGRLEVLHLDAYRLSGPGDLEALGFELQREDARIVLVEWADRVADALPDDRLTIYMEHASGGRTLALASGGARSERLRATLEAALTAAGFPARQDSS